MEEQSATAVLTEDAILGARRRRVDTSLGAALVVRALSFRTLVKLLGQLLDVAALGDAAKAAKGPEDLVELIKGEKANDMLEAIEKVVAAGCVTPKFGDDPAAGPVVADLPIPDQMAAFTAILDLSGYTKKAGAEIRPS
jgi:hypothetical protein